MAYFWPQVPVCYGGQAHQAEFHVTLSHNGGVLLLFFHPCWYPKTRKSALHTVATVLTLCAVYVLRIHAIVICQFNAAKQLGYLALTEEVGDDPATDVCWSLSLLGARE